MRARSKSMSTVGRASRSSARFLAASARATSISSALLGDLRQDRDAIGLHFGEPERDRQVVLLRALAVPQLAGAEQRQQRRVARQDAEVAVGARDLDLVDRLVDERPVGRDDLQLQMLGRQRHGLMPVGHGLRRLPLPGTSR